MNNDSSQTNDTSRREFVKQASLLTGGLIAAPFLSRANYFAGANDTIKIALVGCGGRGTGAAMQALSTTHNVKLVAMADAFRDNLDKCYKSLTNEPAAGAPGGKAKSGRADVKAKVDVPEENKFTGFDAYLKAIPLADVVILATPPGFRPIHFEEAKIISSCGSGTARIFPLRLGGQAIKNTGFIIQPFAIHQSS